MDANPDPISSKTKQNMLQLLVISDVGPNSKEPKPYHLIRIRIIRINQNNPNKNTIKSNLNLKYGQSLSIVNVNLLPKSMKTRFDIA